MTATAETTELEKLEARRDQLATELEQARASLASARESHAEGTSGPAAVHEAQGLVGALQETLEAVEGRLDAARAEDTRSEAEDARREERARYVDQSRRACELVDTFVQKTRELGQLSFQLEAATELLRRTDLQLRRADNLPSLSADAFPETHWSRDLVMWYKENSTFLQHVGIQR